MCNAIANVCPHMFTYACMMHMRICIFASDTCTTKRMLVHANCWPYSDHHCVTTERSHTNKWKLIITSQNFRPFQERSDTPTMCHKQTMPAHQSANWSSNSTTCWHVVHHSCISSKCLEHLGLPDVEYMMQLVSNEASMARASWSSWWCFCTRNW